MLTTEQLFSIGIVAVISAFGGFVHWVRKAGDQRTFMELIKNFTTGIFTGVLAFVALANIDIDITLRYVLAGIASYIGGTLLDMSAQTVQKVAEQKLANTANPPVQPNTPSQENSDPANS